MLIHSRPSVIYQLIFFCLLSPYFVHLSEALQSGNSAIDKVLALAFVKEHLLLFVAGLGAAIFVWRMTAIARWLVALLVLLSLGLSMHIAFIEFNKVVLILSFFYLITSYYLVMVYRQETISASYNPLYSRHTIGNRSEYNLPCTLNIASESIAGILTNWDDQGCFVSLDPGEAGLLELRGRLEVLAKLDGVSFSQLGHIVSSYERGVGIRFTLGANEISEGYNWNEYFKIIDHRGFEPRSKQL